MEMKDPQRKNHKTSQHQKDADCSRGLFRDTEMERRKDKTSRGMLLFGIIEL